MRATLRSWFEALQEEPKRWLYLALAGFSLFWILRGCMPGNSLPGEVTEQIERGRIECITTDETAIRPGETRQPECGRVNVDLVKEGTVPAVEQADGVTRAICYRITIENPRWETMGQTRHELIWAARSYSKVAVLKDGEWQTFPDEYIEDEQRWLEYGCPGAYASE
jgi:hypothetical protein